MNVLLDCKTNEAYAVKILVEALNYYLQKKGSFIATPQGLYLKNIDKNDVVFCDLKLYAENFQEYKCSRSEINFSGNLHTIYSNMLKKIKKKDTIHIQIIEENNALSLKITKESSDDKGNHSSARTPIVESKHIGVNPPEGYDRPINVISKTFQRSCREITHPSNKEIEITCWNGNKIRFYASKDGVVENEAHFGGSVGDAEVSETFKSKFIAAHIIRPVKLAGLSNSIKIYVKEDLPLYYKLNIGSLGELGIYIKSNELIKSEKDTNEDQEDEKAN